MTGPRMTTFTIKHGHAIQVRLELAKVGVNLGTSALRLRGPRCWGRRHDLKLV